jgi:hypothetical protein
MPGSRPPSSLAKPTLRRQAPKARAECVSSASPDLCGGRGATRVPTATGISYSILISIATRLRSDSRLHARLLRKLLTRCLRGKLASRCVLLRYIQATVFLGLSIVTHKRNTLDISLRRATVGLTLPIAEWRTQPSARIWCCEPPQQNGRQRPVLGVAPTTETTFQLHGQDLNWPGERPAQGREPSWRRQGGNRCHPSGLGTGLIGTPEHAQAAPSFR